MMYSYLSANYFFSIFICNMEICNNNIAFEARVGKNALKILKNDFGGDTDKVAKFEHLFDDTFSKNIDNGTVVDVDKSGNYVFSHSEFLKMKHKTTEKPVFKKSFANSLLQECPKTLARIENKMFRTIISKSINSGKSFEDLENIAQKVFKNEKSKNNFLENLSVAKRIKKEYPKSKLKDFEFDYMNMVILEEEAKTPGTDLYNLINNFGKLTFD